MAQVVDMGIAAGGSLRLDWVRALGLLEGCVRSTLGGGTSSGPSPAGGRPAYADPYYRRALALLDTGDRDAAIDHLMTAVEIDEWMLDAYHALALIYDEGRQLPQALACYEELIWRYENGPAARAASPPPSIAKARLRIATMRGG